MRLIKVNHNWILDKKKNYSKSNITAQQKELSNHVFKQVSGKVVTLVDDKQYIEFISCSYLGLDQHQLIRRGFINDYESVGHQFSSSIKRAKHFTYDVFRSNLEQLYNQKVEIFNSVGLVHIGILPLLLAGVLPSYPISGKPIIFIEETSHMSIQGLIGILGQFGVIYRFAANDLNSLEDFLKSSLSNQTFIIISDSIGSMGGLMDVKKIAEFCDKYCGYFYVDDAHGISAIGNNGVGLAYEIIPEKLLKRVIIAGSLSKAFGAHGGFAVINDVGDSNVIKSLSIPINFGGPLPIPSVRAGVMSSILHLDGTVNKLQAKLVNNLKKFDSLFGNNSINNGTISPIRGVKFNKEKYVLQCICEMKKKQIIVTPVFYPTIKKGEGMIRLAISSLHQTGHIDYLYDVVKNFLGENK